MLNKTLICADNLSMTILLILLSLLVLSPAVYADEIKPLYKTHISFDKNTVINDKTVFFIEKKAPV